MSCTKPNATAPGEPPRRKLDDGVTALAPNVRASDIFARLRDDTLAVLLVEAPGAPDALERLRAALRPADGWKISVQVYPRDERTIEEMASTLAA